MKNNTPWYLNNYLFRFEENKDHLIDRLDLEDEQKERLKAFFKKYPNYESKIDWNRKDLTFADFESLLSNEGKSKSQAKKKGLEGITEGVDYKILDQKEDYIAYQPLTYLGSKTIASNAVPPVKENGAKWCTAYQKTSKYWNDYTRKGIRFCYVCTKDTKYALVLYPNFGRECYSFSDRGIRCPENLKYLYNRLLTPEESEKQEKTESLLKKYITALSKTWLKTKTASMPYRSPYKNLITSIVIPDSVTSIGEEAFDGCSNLTSITIPNSVTSIGWHAFSGCSSLESITIPDSVTYLSNSPFYHCTSLTNITIPNSVTRIGDHVFNGCSSLTNITIPDSVTSIGNEAFRECESLESITIPDSVTSIGNLAFLDCKNLTSITIPDSVTSIGNLAFRECEKLTIYYQGTKEQWDRIEGSKGIKRPVVFKKS